MVPREIKANCWGQHQRSRKPPRIGQGTTILIYCASYAQLTASTANHRTALFTHSVSLGAVWCPKCYSQRSSGNWREAVLPVLLKGITHLAGSRSSGRKRKQYYFFHPEGGDALNRLPKEAVDAPSLKAFKARLHVALGSLVCWLATLHIAGGLKVDEHVAFSIMHHLTYFPCR